jgi:hypothetical protein
MRVGLAIVITVAVAVVAAAPASAAVPGWQIGAARIDTTPPAYDAAQDLQDFPEASCPRATFDGPRLWRFEEPYTDTDGSGDFNYPGGSPEPFCDYNGNGRWDGIYLSGGIDHLAKYLHDPIDARAVAFSAGGKTVVLESVVAQGIFENYIRDARTQAENLAGQPPHDATCGHLDQMVVSSNHNESSPDTLGLYGAPDAGGFALHSGIDEYYMDWLDSQMAKVAVAACDQRQAASMRETDFLVPPGIRQEIPNRFPTTNDAGEPTAIDNKIRVLQALDASGDPIFTMMNLADHNQDIGHSDTFEESHSLSGDWPGYFHNRLEQDMADRYGAGEGGMAMFLVGDNGSMEDPITDPAIPDPPCNGGANGCFAQVQLTGDTLADDVASELDQGSRRVRPGPVDGRRTEFCVPLQNQLFAFLASIGTFGERHLYTDCVDTGTVGNELKTSVAVLGVGPDLQFLVNPGEAFPGLVLGNPYGIEDASCDNLANPPVPTWHASAPFRFQVGLGDDMLGYEKPAWSFWDPDAYLPADTCATDPHNHHHGLEDEAVGPAASNAVAEHLTALLDQSPDPTAKIRLGRFVKADGSLTDAYTTPDDAGTPGHFPTDAVAIWLAAPGQTTLNATRGRPDSGTIVALRDVRAFGGRPVDANGDFMDFDGADQPAGPDVDTRGMLVCGSKGTVRKRYYVNVYPALTVKGTLGAGHPGRAPGHARHKCKRHKRPTHHH